MRFFVQRHDKLRKRQELEESPNSKYELETIFRDWHTMFEVSIVVPIRGLLYEHYGIGIVKIHTLSQCIVDKVLLPLDLQRLLVRNPLAGAV